MSLDDIWRDFYIENTRADLDAAWDAAAPSNPVNVLELGVCNGGSLRYWSERVPENGLVVGVDISPTIFDQITGKVRKGNWQIREMVTDNIARLESSREVYVVCGDSSRPETRQWVEGLLGDRKFDLFYHDAMHYDVIPLQDINNYQHLLRMGGTLIVADTHMARQPELIEFCDITYETIGTNQVVHRLPPEKRVLSTSQEMVAWLKDREIKMR
jgi:SAM-dependent methyltransferase